MLYNACNTSVGGFRDLFWCYTMHVIQVLWFQRPVLVCASLQVGRPAPIRLSTSRRHGEVKRRHDRVSGRLRLQLRHRRQHGNLWRGRHGQMNTHVVLTQCQHRIITLHHLKRLSRRIQHNLWQSVVELTE